MEFNVGGLKWAVVAFLPSLIVLSFVDIGRMMYWAIAVGTTVIAYQIGSQLLLRQLRREFGSATSTDEDSSEED